MQIKLYGENDTRPVGSYEWASHAVVTPISIFFVSQTGVRILSNLRFKITLDPNDTYLSNTSDSDNVKITGTVKPKESKESKGKEDDFDTRKPKRPSRGGIGVPQEMACNDSDEKHIPRAKRKNAAKGNAGAEGNLFSDAADRID